MNESVLEAPVTQIERKYRGILSACASLIGVVSPLQPTSRSVSTDLVAIADPLALLLAWGAGLSGAGAFVIATRRVGRGFTWLVAGTAALVAAGGAFVEGALWARASIVALVLAAVAARRTLVASLAMLLAALGFVVEASVSGGGLLSFTAAIALGGVTGEMLLGHWYLVDPRLPRWILRWLAVGGIVGLVLDAVLNYWIGSLPAGGPTWVFWLLAGTSVVLMVGVIGALRYPAYSGVMAATGLSYLAVLTSLGAVFLGRALTAGIGPFAN